MPKKADDGLPGEKLLLLYQILTQESRRHYLGDLATRIQRSTQTVARMIDIVEPYLGKDAILERGMDGRRRYFQLRRSVVSTPTSQADAIRFLNLCRDLTCMLPESLALDLDQSLAALMRRFNDGSNITALSIPIGFRSKGYIDYSPHLGTITILRQAIEKRHVCLVTYQANGRSAPQTYRYAPGRIVAMNGTLYAQGYRLADGSLLKDRPTTFSLHRIKHILPTGEFFRFNASDDDARRFGLNWHEPRRMTVHVAAPAADYVRDRIWSDDQSIQDQPDGSVLLNVTTTSEKELTSWVLSFGEFAWIVSEPARD